MSNEIALIPLSDIERMGTIIAKSGLFGVRTPEQAIALMLIAQAEGLHPAIAARDYHIIEGKPTLKADAMLARFQQSGGKVEWLKLDDKEVEARFTHPSGGSVTLGWNLKMAAQAKLLGRKGEMWEKYPRQMMRARVISEGVRTVLPSVVSGIYTPEEVMDMGPVLDVPPIKEEETPKKPSRTDQAKKLLREDRVIEAPEVRKSEILSSSQYEELLSILRETTKDCSPAGKKDVMAEGLGIFSVLSLRDIPSGRFEEAMAWAKGRIPETKEETS